MSAQSLEGVTGLVAANSLMAMVGGILAALFVSKNDPGFVHNGALAGLLFVWSLTTFARTNCKSTMCSVCGRCTIFAAPPVFKSSSKI